jgi:hypothetical protein
MKRMLLLFLSVACLVSAQSITGLPGVIQITGSAQSVTANNLTSKDIVCLVIRSEGGSKPVHLIIWPFRLPIKAGGEPYNLRSVVPGPITPTSIYVDFVVFADGSYTGPDSGGSLPSVTAGAAAFVAAGQLLLKAPNKATAYSQLQAQAGYQPPPDAPATARRVQFDEAFAIRTAANELVNTKNVSGDAAAEALAARFMTLGTLHPAASN